MNSKHVIGWLLLSATLVGCGGSGGALPVAPRGGNNGPANYEENANKKVEGAKNVKSSQDGPERGDALKPL